MELDCMPYVRKITEGERASSLAAHVDVDETRHINFCPRSDVAGTGGSPKPAFATRLIGIGTTPTMVTTPETVARISAGLDHKPLVS